MVTKQYMADKIKALHEREDELNRRNGELDKHIRILKNEKHKIAKAISRLVLYRNGQVKFWKSL